MILQLRIQWYKISPGILLLSFKKKVSLQSGELRIWLYDLGLFHDLDF